MYLFLAMQDGDAGDPVLLGVWENVPNASKLRKQLEQLADDINNHLNALCEGEAPKQCYADPDYRPRLGSGYNTPDCRVYVTHKEKYRYYYKLPPGDLKNFFCRPYDRYSGYSLGWTTVPDILNI